MPESRQLREARRSLQARQKELKRQERRNAKLEKGRTALLKFEEGERTQVPASMSSAERLDIDFLAQQSQDSAPGGVRSRAYAAEHTIRERNFQARVEAARVNAENRANRMEDLRLHTEIANVAARSGTIASAAVNIAHDTHETYRRTREIAESRSIRDRPRQRRPKCTMM